jgi:hypothetical protein
MSAKRVAGLSSSYSLAFDLPMLIMPPSCLRPRRANQMNTPTRSSSGKNEKIRPATGDVPELVPVTWTRCLARRGDRLLSVSAVGIWEL